MSATAPSTSVQAAKRVGAPHPTHGAYAASICVVAAEQTDLLRREYPHLTEAELAIQGHRLARIEALHKWISVEGVFRRKGPKGTGWSVLRDLSGWERRAEGWFEQRRLEQRERRDEPGAAMRSVLSRMEQEQEPDDADVVDDDEGGSDAA